MRKHHPKNERIKRLYFAYLEEAKRMDTSSVDQVAAAIAQFETSTSHKDFRSFHIEQARKFKRLLGEATNSTTGKPLAVATIYSRLAALKAFFGWLAGQPGYKSSVSYSDADYFNASNNDTRIAKALRFGPVPSAEEIRAVIAMMPFDTDVEKRDRALIAFTFLSGARDNAIASMSLRHVDLAARSVFQDARVVRTKNRKTFTSNFFPVGDDIEVIVAEWISHIAGGLRFGPDDPLFPATRVAVGGTGHFEQAGLDRRHWADAGPIRRIFRAAFERAGLRYYHPHSFRHTLATMGEKMRLTPEEWWAYSQNFGHSSPMTTFSHYGSVTHARKAEIFKGMWEGKTAGRPDVEAALELVTQLLKKAS